MEDGNASSPDLDRSGDIGDKYSLSINPEYWIKLRKRSGSCDVGIDVSPTVVERPLKLVVKPYGQFWKNKRWWSKIEVYPIEKDMRVYTRKVDYGPLNLQLVADHNVATMKSGIHWRIGTNFFREGSRQKLKYPVYKDKDMNVDMNMHWNAEFSLPNMEGGISRSGGEMDIFPGYCHLDVPEVSAKVRFGKPKFQKKKV